MIPPQYVSAEGLVLFFRVADPLGLGLEGRGLDFNFDPWLISSSATGEIVQKKRGGPK
jgi:hypothetical protein